MGSRVRYVIHGDRTVVHTRNGDSFAVETADLALVTPFSWYVEHGYVKRAFRIDGQQKRELLHRRILCAQPGQIVDHIDGDPMNNRRSNLRLCTPAENAANKHPAFHSATGFVGVYARGARFEARVSLNGQRIVLGTFDVAEDAAAAYARARNVRPEFYRSASPMGRAG